MKNTLHFTFLRTLIVLAFGLFFNVAWGQTVNHTFSDTNGTIDDNISYTSQQNSSGTSPAINSGQLRLYYASSGNGGSITLSPSGGAIITQVKITAATTPTVKYNINGLGDLTASRSGSVYTISGISAETSLRIRNANTTNTQLRIESIEITYTIPVVAPPVVTPEAFVGTYNTSFSHLISTF
ncbi:hypothetical protein [Flavobacterium macacae]|uniref:Uncharacterized protein n=1 Tax=Flavobacterium macacae TaxID=2488993 RepID=A0A3P3W7P6_9FLAO|nr:hypothetical protein [Flavobacterium macacae]RRJ90478.1 hypothetical protein EG849_10610 [Flavobacterium macacae]